MNKFLAAFAAIALVGCGSVQDAVDDSDYVCKDGVQYFVYGKMNTAGHMSYSVVPHYKNTKGELFACGETNAVETGVDNGR